MAGRQIGFVLAIGKDASTGQTTALRVTFLELDKDNNIPKSAMQSYIKNGLPIPRLCTLEDLYNYKTVLWNFLITRAVSKQGTPYYKALPKMGVTGRYPIITTPTQEPVYYRAFTIVAKTEQEGMKTEYYWVGNEKRERQVKATFKYFLVANYAGSFSLLSEQQVINLGAKGYILSNAAIHANHIQPIHMHNGKTEFPTMLYDFSVKELRNPRVLTKDKSLPPDWSISTYDALVNAPQVGTPVPAELIVQTRQLADLLVIPDIKKTMLDTQVITPQDNEKIQALYNRMLLWNTVAESDVKYIEKLHTKVQKFLLKNIKMTQEMKIAASIEETERQEELWSGAYEDMQSTLEDPISRLYNTKIYDRFDPNLKSIYCDALKAELTISDKLTRMQNQGILKLDGFEYRIKSPASLAEKVYERSRLENKTPEEIMTTLCDVLRYTVVLPCSDAKDTYTEETKNLTGTTGLGGSYSLCKFANYWGSTSNPYRGINTAFRVPNNQTIFEIQFHTEDSLALKMGKMHKLYEEQRSPGITNARYAELSREMFALSESLRVPKDVIGLDVAITNPLY